MLQFKLKVMIAGIWTKTNLFDYCLLGIRFNFLLLFLLLVYKLAIVNHSTNRRTGIGRNLHEVKFQLISHLQCFTSRVNALLNIIAYQTYLRYSDKFVNAVFWFFLSHWRSKTT